MFYSPEYLNEIVHVFEDIDLSKFEGKTICLSGATGLIGSYLIDSLLVVPNRDIKIIALVRNIDKAQDRFFYFISDRRLEFKEVNLSEKIEIDEPIDYLIHLASLTDPLNYSLHPISTMNTNYLGTKNLLDLASKKSAKFMFISSCEVYGKNESHLIKENDYGYIDILDSRSCYNESKKASETLCICYQKEKGIDVVIPRLSRVYGPTMKVEDTKVLSQFINKALNKENIVLKSKGEQLFNYTYVSDVVRALIILLINKNQHVAYNINSDELIKLKEIAEHIAKIANTRVIFDIPDEVEAKGYSKSNVSSLDNSLFINEYNFKYQMKLFDGIENTIKLIKRNKIC